MCNIFDTSCGISEVRTIPLCGCIPIETNDGGYFYVNEPSSYTGRRSIPYRIISTPVRSGLRPDTSNGIHNSPYLLVHCHGGGYVATSSKSHESYLKDWAKDLKCPIVSIDYSLAPENPYPRAMEEVLYTYAFILNNPEQFGWTGQKIVLCGDSAGGNLVMCTTLKLIDINAKRLPNGLVPIYTPFLFQYLPSPSRVLSFMDPLLHMGVVIRCAAAYANVKCDEKNSSTNNSVATVVNNGHKSLQEYVDEVKNNEPVTIKEMFDSPILSLVNFRTHTKGEEVVVNQIDDVNKVTSHVFTEEVTEEQGEIDDGKDATSQTLKIARDPDNMFLSTNNYDSDLIHFLTNHSNSKS